MPHQQFRRVQGGAADRIDRMTALGCKCCNDVSQPRVTVAVRDEVGDLGVVVELIAQAACQIGTAGADVPTVRLPISSQSRTWR